MAQCPGLGGRRCCGEDRWVKDSFLVFLISCLASWAYADDSSDDFNSYNPPGGGAVPLAGLGGWVTGEADGTTTSVGVKVYDDWGIYNTDAVCFEPSVGFEHIAHNIGYEDDIYLMIRNGLSDPAGTPVQTSQLIRLDFNLGASGITDLDFFGPLGHGDQVTLGPRNVDRLILIN